MQVWNNLSCRVVHSGWIKVLRGHYVAVRIVRCTTLIDHIRVCFIALALLLHDGISSGHYDEVWIGIKYRFVFAWQRIVVTGINHRFAAISFRLL